MKQLFDFLPIILFFIVYKFFLDLPDELITTVNEWLPFMALTPGNESDAIYLATLVAIIATIIQVAFSAILLKKVEKMPIITLVLLVIFGGATLLLKDPLFIQWKPSVINGLFGIGFLLSQFIGSKPLVQRLMSQAVAIEDDSVWVKLNLSWVFFFAISGLANIIVAPAIDPFNFQFSESTWVDFKLFGLMGMTIAFVIGQAFYLARFMPETTKDTK
jgi:intracellular septation protein